MTSQNKPEFHTLNNQSQQSKDEKNNKPFFKSDQFTSKIIDDDKVKASPMKMKKSQQKSKRRSRHEEDGRIFKCECGKSYLSDTALTNHRIVKHNYHSEKRGKGRPKKYESPIQFTTNCFVKYNEVFFTHPLRVKKEIKAIPISNNIEDTSVSNVKFMTNKNRKEVKGEKKRKESEDNQKNEYHNLKPVITKKIDNNDLVNQWLGSLFETIFLKLSKSLLSKYKNHYEKYPLYSLFLSHIHIIEEEKDLNDGHIEKTKLISVENSPYQDSIKIKSFNIDHCLIEYLCFVFNHTNKEYFHFSLLFIILLREFLNSGLINKSSFLINSNLDYSSDPNVTPQEIPNYCESFMGDFLEPHNYYDIYDPEEILQIIQHFCYWLFDKGYTTLRITLVNLTIPN